MRICHFSDAHWSFANWTSPEYAKLPKADLYICTGDMICNFPTMDPDRPKWMGRQIVPAHERETQPRAITQFVAKRGFRPLLGSPDAPVVCVRGNHDFCDLASLFVGCNLVHEFVNNELIEVLGLKMTGHRGIPWIHGTWNDEISREDLMDRVRAMPTADVYVTHYPPSGIGLDGERGIFYGLDGMLNELVYRDRDQIQDFSALPTALALSGHIHERGGNTFHGGHILFSNAATTFNVIEGDTDRGWVHVNKAT